MNVCPQCFLDRARRRDEGGCRCLAKPKTNALGQNLTRRRRTRKTRVVLKPTDGDAA